MNTDLQFPSGFVWGSATASYQIEGAVDEDGRGASIWDTFSATSGKVRNGETGAVACDHYHRYRDDVELMRALGINAYRFSIAWPRVIPHGRGSVNERGLDFYDRLVDALLERDIQPYATLYHWDLPQPLQDDGGWANRNTVDAYVAYVEAVVRRLGDRVHSWITHNEPWVAAWLGYGWGTHAPGERSQRGALAAAHHLLLSHGQAVPIIRRDSPDAGVGITLNLTPVYAAEESEENAAAVRRSDGHGNRWFLDAVFRGQYPVDMVEIFSEDLPEIRDGDLKDISVPIDFLGINNYSRSVVRAADPPQGIEFVRTPNATFTAMDWEVYPDGLYDLLRRVHDDYGPKKIYVTENGAAFYDTRTHDGSVKDPERVQFIESYLRACKRAVDEGVPLAGYFVWSLLDNFEWAEGYAKRFGIVFIDFPTLERVPKSSFAWYRDLVAQQRTMAEST